MYIISYAQENLDLITTIFLGLSGWTAFLYNFITNRPKINGRIFPTIWGTLVLEEPSGESKKNTMLLVYLYLTTKRKTPIRALDYEIEVTLKKMKSQKFIRAYGLGIENKELNMWNGEKFDPKLSENLIYKKKKPIEQQDPLHGFVLFVTDNDFREKLDNNKIKKIKITVIDVFGKRHVITQKENNERVNLNLLSDIADLDLPNDGTF